MNQEKCGSLDPLALAIAMGSLWGVYVFVLGLILAVVPTATFFWEQGFFSDS